jgi:hypothetical protein
VNLFPRWGVLRTSNGDVVFLSEQLLFNNVKNVSRRSLLDFVVVGDVLATHCILTDYLDLSCKASELPGTNLVTFMRFLNKKKYFKKAFT